MNIILFGYNGSLGKVVLEDLFQKYKKIYNFKIICIGRDAKSKPFKNKKIIYVEWDFLNFSKLKFFFLKKNNVIINCIGKNFGSLQDLRGANLIFIQKLINYICENKIWAHLIHLSSVSVYSVEKKNFNRVKNISENSKTKSNNSYSKSKLDADLVIQKAKIKNNNNFSYTILRISNVFGLSKNSNAFAFIIFLLKKGIWLKCSKDTRYHFVHAKDVASAVSLCAFNLKISRNKIYIVSDDINQSQLHEIYAKKYNLNLSIIPISLRIASFITKFFFLSKKIQNLFFTISSEINYDSSEIKKELNFKTLYSLRDKII